MIEFAAESHPGNRYQHNEDSLGWVEEAGVWLVADGMGGHACGDVASRTVKQSLLRASAAASEQAKPSSLPELISQAHAAVVAEGIRRSAENMGSTVVMVRVSGDSAEIGWCGDSRVYLWRDKQLVRLTRDHSLLEQLLESGVVDPSEAFGHPQKHVLVQALGISNPEPVPAKLHIDLANEDMLLLCSDGLHDELRDDEINELIVANPEPGEAVRALIARTLLGEARDNISVVCLRMSGLASSQPPLSVPQLRARFERLPGRRDTGAVAEGSDSVTPARTPQVSLESATADDSDLSGIAPAPRVAVAGKIKLPKRGASAGGSNGAQSSIDAASDVKPTPNKFDRELLIALVVVAAMIALVLWIS